MRWHAILAKFLSDRGTHLAAMIAYFATLAFVPLLFLALSLIGVFGQAEESSYLIEQLRKGQYAPVHLLDEVSKSLPDRLWLSDLTQTGTEFTIGGMTDSLTAVSDFVANLEGTRWFKKPVEILDSQVQTDAKAGDLIKFQIKAQFVDPTAPPEPPAPAKPATGRGRGE